QPLPRAKVEDDYAAGRVCAICGQLALAVVHLERLPDYIRCSNCGSAFVLGDGSSLVMYGSIPADYPGSRELALKRWVGLPAIQAKADADRAAVAAAVAEPGPARADGAEVLPVDPALADSAEEPTPPFGIGSAAGQDNGSAERASTPPFGIGTLHDFLSEQPGAPAAGIAEAGEQAELGHESAEPDPGQRFRVLVSAQHPSFPTGLCAHCLRQPADRGLVVIGADANRTRYQVPLCQLCNERVRARSEEEKNSRLAVQLGSIAIGMILMVTVLALDVLDVRQAPLAAVLVLGALGLIGYTLPAWLLLRRLSRLPPAPDSAYVRSTLQIRPGLDGEPTGYLWRNRGFAERFAAANAAGDVARVSESNGS
ncbi:MAG: hypothetical protein ACRDHG_15125, partial [Anaerolineales bacterium]